jgi:O-antigen/teichoic acid export membrane protein
MLNVNLLSILISRGGGAIFALVSSVFILKNLGAHDSGVFFTNIAYSMFFVVFITFGGNQSLLKNIKPKQELENILKHHFKVTIKLYVFFVPFAFLIINVIFKIHFYQVLLITLCSLVYSISQQLHHCCIAVEKQSSSYIFHTWIPNIIIIVFSFTHNINVVLFCYIFGYVLSSILQVLVITFRINTGKKEVIIRENWSTRADFFQQDMLGQIYTSLIIVIAANYLREVDIAKLSMYIKIASVCNIFIGILNVSSFPKVISKIREGHITESIKLINTMSLIGCSFILFYSIVVYFSWKEIVILLEIESISVNMVVLLIFSYLGIAYSSSRQMLLNSLGYSKWVRNYSWIVFLFGISSLLYMSKNYELKGTVVSLSLILILQAIFNILSFRKVSNE